MDAAPDALRPARLRRRPHDKKWRQQDSPKRQYRRFFTHLRAPSGALRGLRERDKHGANGRVRPAFAKLAQKLLDCVARVTPGIGAI
jgi:hypothetical protein